MFFAPSSVFLQVISDTNNIIGIIIGLIIVGVFFVIVKSKMPSSSNFRSSPKSASQYPCPYCGKSAYLSGNSLRCNSCGNVSNLSSFQNRDPFEEGLEFERGRQAAIREAAEKRKQQRSQGSFGINENLFGKFDQSFVNNAEDFFTQDLKKKRRKRNPFY